METQYTISLDFLSKKVVDSFYPNFIDLTIETEQNVVDTVAIKELSKTNNVQNVAKNQLRNRVRHTTKKQEKLNKTEYAQNVAITHFRNRVKQAINNQERLENCVKEFKQKLETLIADIAETRKKGKNTHSIELPPLKPHKVVTDAYNFSVFKSDNFSSEHAGQTCNTPSNIVKKITVFKNDSQTIELQNEEKPNVTIKTCYIHGWGKIEVASNNSHYEGKIKNGLSHGLGSLKTDSSSYEGQFKRGFFEGYGKEEGTNTSYHGQWREGQKNGWGEYVSNAETYKGEFLNNKFHGYGVLSVPSGRIYIGEFKNNLFDGKGTRVFANGDTYTGQWKEGVFCGRGKLVKADGHILEGLWKSEKLSGTVIYPADSTNGVYEGDWENNKPAGEGKMTYRNAEVYQGQWENGQRVGHGKITYNNDEEIISLEGEWKNDQILGKNLTVTFSNLSTKGTYTGDWLDNCAHGTGKTSFPTHHATLRYHEGEYLNGMFHGIGILIYKNNESYNGQLKNDRRHGSGELTMADGTVQKGIWENDQLIKTLN